MWSVLKVGLEAASKIAVQTAIPNSRQTPVLTLLRCGHWKIKKPEPGHLKCYRRIVHYPEKYTVEPLQVTNLAGRDPVTGIAIFLWFYMIVVRICSCKNIKSQQLPTCRL